MYERSRVKVEVEPRPTSRLSATPSYLVSILFSRVKKDTEYCNSSLPKEQASLRLDVIWDTLSRKDPPQRRARRGKGNEYSKKM